MEQIDKITKLFTRIIAVSLLWIAMGSRTVNAQQDTVMFSLEDVLARMDTSYPALLEYHQRLQAVEAETQAARSWMPPTVSVGVDRFGYKPGMWMEQSPMNQAGIMISAEQMIPNPKKLDARANAVQAQAAPLQFDSAWLRNDLRMNARLYYYQRFIAERKLAILKESIIVLDMLISTAEGRYPVNQSDLSTIFKAKARRAELSNMEAMLQAQVTESNYGLNTLMNRNLYSWFGIDTVVQLRSFSDTVVFDSLSNRSDILAMNANIYQMRMEQTSMKTSLRPDFGVRVTHMQMLGMDNSFSVMGMMIIPLAPWSSGMYNSEARAMDFEIEEMELQKENMQLMAKQMAAERMAMLHFETLQLQNYDSLIIPSYEANYEAALLAYRNNTGNFFVLLDAWDMLLMKKMEAADQLGKVLILQTQYEYETEQ